MSFRQDYRLRRSFSYKMKRWFWSDHTEEIKMVFKLIGEFILAALWLGMVFILPHIFH
jgi:hypothetical protein